MKTKKYQEVFHVLTNQLDIFIDIVKSTKLSLMVSEEWTVKDLLCHIVFWHEMYAANYKAQDDKTYFELPDQMSTINTRGVASLNMNSREILLNRLSKAHESLRESIIVNQVPSMKYSKKGRIYETGEFLEMIARHINTHTKQLSKSKRKVLKDIS